MIAIQDAGVRAAVERAVGHAGPYQPEELAAITSLRIHHAAELSALAHCTGLTALALTACAVTTLAEPARLPRLSTLHALACPVEETTSLARHPALTELRIDFGFIQDIAPLTTIPRLRHGRFLGNPIDPAGWTGLRPRWQRSRTAETGRLRLLEFGPEAAWRHTRAAWEHGVRLCSGLLDGLRPIVVRPGIPPAPNVLVDAIHGYGAAIVADAAAGDSTETIYRRNADWAAGAGFPSPTDFSSHRRLGDAHDARSWLAEASTVDQPPLERFIARFPDGLFFREDAAVHAAMAEHAGAAVPPAVAAARSVLAGILVEDDTRFRVEALANSPRAESAGRIWYRPAAGVYATEQRRRLLRDAAGVFPLADWVETGHSLLGVRLDGDPAVYEFGEEDLYLRQDSGQSLDESLYRVFGSHAELLAHIAAYRYPDGTEVTAQTGEA